MTTAEVQWSGNEARYCGTCLYSQMFERLEDEGCFDPEVQDQLSNVARSMWKSYWTIIIGSHSGSCLPLCSWDKVSLCNWLAWNLPLLGLIVCSTTPCFSTFLKWWITKWLSQSLPLLMNKPSEQRPCSVLGFGPLFGFWDKVLLCWTG